MARVRSGEAANPSLPTVARVRLRFAKRGRLRFLSHRDVARSIERAVRRAGRPGVPLARFQPAPAADLELRRPDRARRARPSTWRSGSPAPSTRRSWPWRSTRPCPDGLDVLGAALSDGGALADRIDAARWRIELSGVTVATLQEAVDALQAATEVLVERVTPKGRRHLDVRAALVSAAVTGGHTGPDTSAVASDEPDCAILTAVVRQGVTSRSTRRRVGRSRRCRRSAATGPREGDPAGPGSARRPGRTDRSAGL